jgi:hypothetical protein
MKRVKKQEEENDGQVEPKRPRQTIVTGHGPLRCQGLPVWKYSGFTVWLLFPL